MSDHVQSFSMTHGLNLLTVNVLRRWFPKSQRDGSFLGRIQPYVGLGAGVAIPHAEAVIDGVETYEYQLAGPAVQGFAGLNLDVWGPLSIFTEYKVSCAPVSIDLESGGTLETAPISNEFILGISARF